MTLHQRITVTFLSGNSIKIAFGLISSKLSISEPGFVADQEVIKILTQVKVTKREAEIKLDETDFYEKKIINKKKKLILEGKDPELEEELHRLAKKEACKKRKRASEDRRTVTENGIKIKNKMR